MGKHGKVSGLTCLIPENEQVARNAFASCSFLLKPGDELAFAAVIHHLPAFFREDLLSNILADVCQLLRDDEAKPLGLQHLQVRNRTESPVRHNSDIAYFVLALKLAY